MDRGIPAPRAADAIGLVKSVTGWTYQVRVGDIRRCNLDGLLGWKMGIRKTEQCCNGNAEWDGSRPEEVSWCARLSPALPAGETPAPEREEPPHRESSLGLMEATT